MTEQLKALLTFCKSNGRVCPQPVRWNELWEILPDKERNGLGWNPSLPLTLAAWWEASPTEKRNQLQKHLIYAEEKGILDKVAAFLCGPPEDQWFHEND
jgi:hypothetical protein